MRRLISYGTCWHRLDNERYWNAKVIPGNWIELAQTHSAVKTEGVNPSAYRILKYDEFNTKRIPMKVITEPIKDHKHILDAKHAIRHHSTVNNRFNSFLKTVPDLFNVTSFLGTHVELPCQVDLMATARQLQDLRGTGERDTMLKHWEWNQISKYIGSKWGSRHK